MTTTEATEPKLPEATITEEAMAELRARIGTQLRPEQFIREATIDTITNFCNGIGDQNPLHRDPSAAQWTRYGTIVAPHLFLYSRTWPGRTRFGLAGVHGFHAGNDFTFHRRVRIGDRIDAVDKITGVEEKQSAFSGRLVITMVETTFTNQHGELVAVAKGWNTRHERKASREAGKYKSDTDRTPDLQQVLRAEEMQVTELDRIRGADVRYWEDVNVGDELDELARGPLTTTDVTAFLVGCGRGRAHGVMLREAGRHAQHYFRNPDAGGALEYTGMGHQLGSVAAQVGAPGVYDFGPQRISWLGTCVEYWMGNDGFIKRLRGELRRFNIVGDITYVNGKVVGKRFEGDEALVDIELTGTNQLGEVTIPGLATVRLPSKRVTGQP